MGFRKQYFQKKQFYKFLKDFKHFKLLLKMARLILLISIFCSLHVHNARAYNNPYGWATGLQYAEIAYSALSTNAKCNALQTQMKWCQTEQGLVSNYINEKYVPDDSRMADRVDVFSSRLVCSHILDRSSVVAAVVNADKSEATRIKIYNFIQDPRKTGNVDDWVDDVRSFCDENDISQNMP